jgi:outer membrane scaffolding protein for murein synthesis (MipA/OmpV family)
LGENLGQKDRGVPVLSKFLTRRRASLVAGAIAMMSAIPATAQDDEPECGSEGLFGIFGKPCPETRTRIGLGPGFSPSYPGADKLQIYPLVEFERVNSDRQFDFEAPDESFGFNLVNAGGFSFGPVVNFEDKRTAEDVGTLLPEVDFSVEPGVFVQYDFGDNFRLRSELRKGVTGHDGWIANAGADVIFRNRDEWLFSIGPRVTWSDDTYHDAYFSVAPADAIPSGLPAFDADGGIQAYGATASTLFQVSRNWGVLLYGKYDRLTGDAADSPIVLTYGSRDQFSFGGALLYTFGPGVH